MTSLYANVINSFQNPSPDCLALTADSSQLSVFAQLGLQRFDGYGMKCFFLSDHAGMYPALLIIDAIFF
jgi:hypothetical protein